MGDVGPSPKSSEAAAPPPAPASTEVTHGKPSPSAAQGNGAPKGSASASSQSESSYSTSTWAGIVALGFGLGGVVGYVYGQRRPRLTQGSQPQTTTTTPNQAPVTQMASTDSTQARPDQTPTNPAPSQDSQPPTKPVVAQGPQPRSGFAARVEINLERLAHHDNLKKMYSPNINLKTYMGRVSQQIKGIIDQEIEAERKHNDPNFNPNLKSSLGTAQRDNIAWASRNVFDQATQYHLEMTGDGESSSQQPQGQDQPTARPRAATVRQSADPGSLGLPKT